MQQNVGMPFKGRKENPVTHFNFSLFLGTLRLLGLVLKGAKDSAWLRAGLVAELGEPMCSFIFRKQKAQNGN